MHVQPYLFFDGRCEEALDFYRGALGAEVLMLMRFKEAPPIEPGAAPQDGGAPAAPDPEHVMHASIRIGNSILMASDGMRSGTAVFAGISLSIEAGDVAETERIFAALAEGGQIQMPLAETFFSPRFGMVADRFGVSWMVAAAAPAP